ncbi:MAG: sulfatase-like hydrolase/transferase [Bacteroidales bacterium]|jgi:phosphoglycerol transferase MdoB-like AlkP superfamily enzyme|nr:sulfatase-like hydrolase/transferase [Bacteroidales bacterium]
MKEYLKSYLASFKQIRIKNNIHLSLVYYLLIMMLLFTISRLGFYFFNKSLFPQIDLGRFLTIMIGGLKFDLSAILYTNLLFLTLYLIPQPFRYHKIFQSILKYIYYITNSIILAVNTSDFIYYRFTVRRTTFKIFGEFKNETNGFSLFLEFIIDYWYAVLFWIFLVALMIYLFKKVKTEKPIYKNHLFFYSSGLAMMLLMVYLTIGGLRGGFRHSTRPITLSNAGKYVESPNQMAIVLNTPFSVYRTIGKAALPNTKYFSSQKELNEIYNPVFQVKTDKDFKYNNVVILIMESFSREYFGFFNKHLDNGTYQGYTPFLDSLIQNGRTYWHTIANGRKSIDVLPSVLTSIPSVKTPFVLSYYSSNKLNSIASLLKKKGYHTSFFHGAPNGSMGLQSFVNLVGFDHYYGRTEYGLEKEWDGIWGVWDHDFLSYFAKTLSTFEEPFVSALFSVSSHHPYNLPAEFEGKFPEGKLPVHRTIGYSDYSLKQFFEEASNYSWYDSTLFVITADHASAQIGFPEYKTIKGYYSVPIIFYHPTDNLTGLEYDLAQQIDIMPSILSYLNYDESYISFGQDLFNGDKERFVINVLNDVYQLYMDDYLIQYNESEILSLYKFKVDSLFQHNLIGTMPEVEEKMLKKVQAFIQEYNYRMINDELTID